MTALLLSALPLQMICQLIGSGQPGITENGTLIDSQLPTQGWRTILPEGYVEFPDVRSAYKLSDNNATWTEARRVCISEGGRLAIADNERKIAHVRSLDGAKGNWIHVGIHSLFDGEWVRVDNGLPVNYIPWATNNPDGTGQCAGIYNNQNGLGDYGCKASVRFVCEIPSE